MGYDPFQRGPFPVGVRSTTLSDATRGGRRLPVEVWYPATDAHVGEDTADPTRDRYEMLPGLPSVSQDAVRDAASRPGRWPLVAFSHGYGGHRRQSTFLCTHLASHGYVVASVDHVGNTVFEVVHAMMTAQMGGARVDPQATLREFIVARPADAAFLIDAVLDGAGDVAAHIDAERIGMAGHSFGGWTTLVTTARDRRIRAALPLAPAGGATHLDATALADAMDLRFGREVPTLFIAADQDSLLPLAGIRDLYERTPAPKRFVVLERSDHLHFMDRIEENHELFRSMPQDELFRPAIERMRPMAELAPEGHAYAAVRGLGLAHMDAVLKGNEAAARFLAEDAGAALAAQGIRVSLS
jgi:predicted dienelactone hydrolase